MTGIFSILQSSYTASSTNSLFSPGSKFANVDPTKWQGTWTGKDFKNQPFTIRITNVKGFRANVTFESSAGLQVQQAFITTKNSFRIGNSSFALTGAGTAKLITIVTDPNTGIQTANTATATQKT
jgi:hypothetical protein